MNNSLAPTSIPAASGCNTGKFSVFFLRLGHVKSFRFCRSDAQGAKRKQTPNRDRRRWRRHHKTVRNPGPMLIVGLQVSSTNVGAGCGCHPTGPSILPPAPVPCHSVWPRPVACLSAPISVDGVSREESHNLWTGFVKAVSEHSEWRVIRSPSISFGRHPSNLGRLLATMKIEDRGVS